jgi:pimeloyl-ACP methyl ester carboxylesterase
MSESTARVAIDGGELETVVLGSGDPVALVPTALMADELLPLAERLRRRFRVVHYHRRGYARSSPASPPGSVAREAADCARLLAALAIERVHVLGVSFSTAVALQMAVDHPELVHTLTLVEPPPVHGPGDAEFRAANAGLLADRQARGAEAAVDRFLRRTVGPAWRSQLDGAVPGSPEQVLRDSRTFFDVDIPALLSWPFDAGTAARVRCPVLHVGGSDHGPLFDGVGDLIHAWLPIADQVTIAGAGHDVVLTHPDVLIEVLVPFLARHPVG